VNYKYRMHDPRLGRFFAVDPLAGKYSYNSTYAFSENRVTDAVELEGLECIIVSVGARAMVPMLSASASAGIAIGIDGVFAFVSYGTGFGMGAYGGIGIGVAYFNGSADDFAGNAVETGYAGSVVFGGEICVTQSSGKGGAHVGIPNAKGFKFSAGKGAGYFMNNTYTHLSKASWSQVGKALEDVWHELSRDLPANFKGMDKKQFFKAVTDGIVGQMDSQISILKSEEKKLVGEYHKFDKWHKASTTEDNKKGNMKMLKSTRRKLNAVREKIDSIEKSKTEVKKIVESADAKI
jgi:hypothetical protein